MSIQQHKPMHPGVFIKKVYLDEFNIGNNEFARKLKVSPGLVSRFLNGKVDVSTEMALKLSIVLGRSHESWAMMQANYNFWCAKKEVDLSDLKAIKFAV